jgi:hypothetical protein
MSWRLGKSARLTFIVLIKLQARERRVFFTEDDPVVLSNRKNTKWPVVAGKHNTVYVYMYIILTCFGQFIL